MKYVRMGSTGAQVSQLCLGCMSFGSMADWTLNEPDSLPIVRKAVEAGINFFDTADAYSRGQSEEILGRSLKELKVRRFDYLTPIEETIEALDDVVKAGKALYIGASSMFAYQFSKYLLSADKLGATRFSMMQNHYSLLYREEEREMNPLCAEEGVGLIPWSPLAGGVLAGNREAGTTRAASAMGRSRFNRQEDQAVVDALRSVAKERGESPAQVAIAWMLSKPAVTAPILGVTKAAHLDDPIKAVDNPLSEAEIAILEAPYVSQAVIGPQAPAEATLPEFRARAAEPAA
jgi:aryl-alcohol dehydrogenase-like predicted oxidoreductase